MARLTMKALPDRLYKYIKWDNKFSREILVSNTIYFSSPKKFNDPFDCSLAIRYDQQSPEHILNDYKISLRRNFPEYDSDKINKLAEEIQNNNPDLYTKIAGDILESNLNIIYNNAGVFSTSEVHDNILMWSHYSDSHKGICIGFDANKLFKFLNENIGSMPGTFACTPIKYQNKYPIIKPEWPDAKIGSTILTTKAKFWQYEKEWRFIIWGQTDIELSIPEGIITDVVFGCCTPKNHKDDIIHILRANKCKIDVKIASVHHQEFKLNLNPINY